MYDFSVSIYFFSLEQLYLWLFPYKYDGDALFMFEVMTI